MDLALGIAAGHVLAFVVRSLAARERELDLYLSFGEIQRQWHEGEVTISYLADQSVDLLPM
jgi:hypothetical protein